MFVSIRRLAVLFTLFPALAFASPTAVTFSDLSLPVTPGANGAAFFTVVSPQDDKITAAESACCKAVELHRHEIDGEVMRMRRVPSVDLVAGEPTVFEPGSLHVMLIGLKKPLAVGDSVAVTFHFAHAPAQKVLFTASAPRLHGRTDSPNHHH